MRGYVRIYHPQRIGEVIEVVPTGKTEGEKAEGLVIRPGSNLSRVFFKRGDILETQYVGDNSPNQRL